MSAWRGQPITEWAFTPPAPDDFTDAQVIGTIDPGAFLVMLDAVVDDRLPAVLYHRHVGAVTLKMPLGSILKFALPYVDEYQGSSEESAAIVVEARETATEPAR